MQGISYPHRELTRTPADLSKFWVITVVSNPVRYKRRYELYWRFAEMCKQAGVNLVTVEQAFGDRPFMITEAGNKFHLQLRSVDELWHKENMYNLAAKHAMAIAPGEVRQLAFVDADLRPARPYRDWFEETWHQLQHYQWVQMWESLIDLDVNFNVINAKPQPSFMGNYLKHGIPKDGALVNPYEYNGGMPGVVWGAPGGAWAANVEAFNQVGGFYEKSILGAGDWQFACGVMGIMDRAVSAYKGMPYADDMMLWGERANRWLKRDVGMVPGMVYHDFHGSKRLRFYSTRGQILIENQYNPHTDVKYDAHGMLQLETWDERQINLRDGVRTYFRARNEDSIDL